MPEDRLPDPCRWSTQHAAAFFRSLRYRDREPPPGGLTDREFAYIEDHLGQCGGCASLFEDAFDGWVSLHFRRNADPPRRVGTNDGYDESEASPPSDDSDRFWADKTLPLQELSDGQLISRVRAGDADAYVGLLDRHRAAAYGRARQLAPGPVADNWVSQAFATTLSRIRSGGGPHMAFRAYLLAMINRVSRGIPDDAASSVPSDAELLALVHGGDTHAAAALASLPERWQMVLRHLEVEGQEPAEVGVLLGLNANGVSQLAYRAREGLRQAFLREPYPRPS